MKFFAFIAVALLAGGAGYFVATKTSHSSDMTAHPAKAEQLYTCGMHPQIIQNKPGNCPICGMKLTPIRRQPGAQPASAAAGERKIKNYKSTMMPGEVSPVPAKDSMGMDMVPVYEDGAGDASTISIDPVTVQNMGLRTGLVTTGPLRHHVRTVGTVEFDETSQADVTTKVKGWIEKLYVDTTGELVHRGEPLFEFYSPELYSAQTEYLLALDSNSESLKATALNKLKFYDISEKQIAELEKTRKIKKTLQIVAPRDGIVVEKKAVEGEMVDPGMNLYRLADLSLVWVRAQVYEQDLPFISLGQDASVTLSYLPDRNFRGRVTYIYPTIDKKTRTALVRMEFHNPGYYLKPGMFATVELESELAPSVVLVPDSAVLRSGEKDTVFVALDGGHFDPRTVTLGPRADGDEYQVLDGLKAGERVVISGQFMLDSESQLREAIQKMTRGEVPGEPVKPKQPTMKMAPAPAADDIVYICPMPEHVSITYKAPGKCPLCGMTLVPVTRQTLSKIQPGAAVDYYTCPMPEHSSVHESKPGKCPLCGMTLIPIMKKAPEPTVSKPAPPPLILYTCPMEEHADVVSDHPGKCPKCGMDLVETSTVAHGKIAEQHWKEEHSK